MITYMPRSMFEPGGMSYEFRKVKGLETKPLPPHVAGIRTCGRFHREWEEVTWAEIMDRRREEQRERLARQRGFALEERPVLIEVKHYGYWLMGGWHTYIFATGGQGRYLKEWYKHGDITAELMQRFPLTQHNARLFPCTNAEDWMISFAHTYHVGTFKKKPRGLLKTWVLMEMFETGPVIRKFL